MPELPVSDEQHRRLEAVCEDLEAAYVGPYGTVRPEDALEYLLDTYSPPESEAGPEGERASDAGSEDEDGTAADAGTADEAGGEGDDAGAGTETGASSDGSAESAGSALQQAMNLLEAHDDKWREASGDEPYEVDLPDGSTEAVRTKDDIKRLLFKHWK